MVQSIKNTPPRLQTQEAYKGKRLLINTISGRKSQQKNIESPRGAFARRDDSIKCCTTRMLLSVSNCKTEFQDILNKKET